MKFITYKNKEKSVFINLSKSDKVKFIVDDSKDLSIFVLLLYINDEEEATKEIILKNEEKITYNEAKKKSLEILDAVTRTFIGFLSDKEENCFNIDFVMEIALSEVERKSDEDKEKESA